MTSLVKQGEWRAFATFVGTVIGAGIFGVPYVMQRAGVLVGLIYFVVLGILITFANLYYADVVLAVRGKHRFPGFAEKMLGKFGKRIAAFLGIVGGWLSITIYIIIGGRFLFLIGEPFFGGTEFIYHLVFTAFGALVVFGGLRWVARAEMTLSLLLIIVMAMIAVLGVSYIDASNFVSIDFSKMFLPYGVILFSIGGFTVIPQLEDLVGDGKRKALRRVLMRGMAFVTIITAVFGVLVVGISGVDTSSDAISGLAPILGSWVVLAGAVFGFLAVITSFITFLLNQCEIFQMDYGFSRLVAWSIGLVPALLLFLFGARNFISMLGLSGGFLGGLGALMIVAMYLALLRQEKKIGARAILPIVVGCLFLAGVFAQTFDFFKS